MYTEYYEDYPLCEYNRPLLSLNCASLKALYFYLYNCSSLFFAIACNALRPALISNYAIVILLEAYYLVL